MEFLRENYQSDQAEMQKTIDVKLNELRRKIDVLEAKNTTDPQLARLLHKKREQERKEEEAKSAER